MRFLRSVLAVFAGLIAGGMMVTVFDVISSLMYPAPDGLDMTDRKAMTEWVATLPNGAFAVLPIGWFFGCLVGPAVARVVAVGRGMVPPLIVWFAFIAATVINLFALPHPGWLWPVGILACIAGGLIGLLLVKPRSFLVSSEITIAASPEQVFQVVALPENFSAAIPDIQAVEFLSEQRSGVGAKFRETRLMNGREAASVLEITELSENEFVRIVTEAGGAVWDSVFRLRGADETTELTLEMEAKPVNIGGHLMTPMLLGMIRKAIAKDMEAVKAYCESMST